MKFQHFFLLISLSFAKGNILSESYNIFENATFASTGQIIIKTEFPNKMKSTDCLIECNQRHICLTAHFKINSDTSSICELIFTPYNLTNTLQVSTGVTIYQKKSKYSMKIYLVFNYII